MLCNAHGKVATPVKTLWRHSPEITHPRQGDVNQFGEKIIHPVASQGHAGPYRHALPKFEGCAQEEAHEGAGGPGPADATDRCRIQQPTWHA